MLCMYMRGLVTYMNIPGEGRGFGLKVISTPGEGSTYGALMVSMLHIA